MKDSTDCRAVAEAAMERHVATHSLNHYAGIVTLQGAVQLAMATGDDAVRRRACELLRPFVAGDVHKVGGQYDKMYRCGGNATAWAVKAGFMPDALPTAVAHAEELIATHPRDGNGIFGKLGSPEKIWIDSAFAVCPFLAITGVLAGRREFIDEACHQMLGMHEALLDRANGLYHQSLNFAGPGKLSQDHWSRGNGWAALPLADLAVELPEDHAERDRLRALFLDHMTACVKVQDAQGMWHQELTDHDSYVETSGTGLILYGIGRGLVQGLLPEPFLDPFVRGLRGYLRYIALDGSVFNTCRGCLCPGDGSIEAYKAREWVLNDAHAFGPVVLAFAQAIQLGIRTVQL